MSLVLDAGALIAYERGDAAVEALLRAAEEQDVDVRTSGAVVAQVWRDGARQAPLARALRGVEVLGLDGPAGRHVGELLCRNGSSDVVDGHVATIAEHGDTVLTSDPVDLAELLDASGTDATIREV